VIKIFNKGVNAAGIVKKEVIREGYKTIMGTIR
jgi:hypothetical protein